MQAVIRKEIWQETLQHYEIVDVAVRDRNIIYVSARKQIPHAQVSLMRDAEVPTRIIGIYLDEPRDGANWGRAEFSGMNLPVLGTSRRPFPHPSALLSAKNKDGDTFPFGSGLEEMEQIAPGQRPIPNRLKTIGSHVYAVCAFRRIYRRTAVGRWESFGALPHAGDIFQLGFHDLDAFSESDMYAVGGHGDVWHYDGTRWAQLGFPSNVQLGTVTCADDGNVYISGEGGSLWIGRGQNWKKIHHGDASILWNDTLWFNDQLWLASDYQLRTWDGTKLRTVHNQGKPVTIQGNMDAHDGLLVVASRNEVMAYDGTDWRSLVTPYF